MFTSKTRFVLGGLFMVLATATVAFGQTRPEFTPEYWAKKRLPDSMKGISPEHLASFARMNNAARQAKNSGQVRQWAR